jgi:hypothetical protein
MAAATALALATVIIGLIFAAGSSPGRFQRA